jgi:hypothetical protein
MTSRSAAARSTPSISLPAWQLPVISCSSMASRVRWSSTSYRLRFADGIIIKECFLLLTKSLIALRPLA